MSLPEPPAWLLGVTALALGINLALRSGSPLNTGTALSLLLLGFLLYTLSKR